MKQFKVAATACCVALIGTALASTAQADEWNKKTVFTFSGPVETPGVHLKGWGVLPAGTYVFKLLDSQSDRHIVQIFDKDETTVYATILAIPDYRLKATHKTVVTFRERPVGEPEALRAWFYPGANWGEEFVYPKSKAAELAKDANTPVLFTPAEIPLEVESPINSLDEPVMTQLRIATILAITPAGEDVQAAAVVTAEPGPEPAATLPATASNAPLIGFIGFLALSGALILGIAAKRTV